MTRTRSLLILFLPLVFLACEQPQAGDAESGAEATAERTATPADADAVEAEVARIRDAWVQAAEAGDAATVASLYAEDARMAGMSDEPAEGRQSIQDALTTGFEGLSNLDVSSTELVVGSDVVSDMGTFTQSVRTPDGQEQSVSGQYIVVLRRQADGSWKIVQHLTSIPQDTAAASM